MLRAESCAQRTLAPIAIDLARPPRLLALRTRAPHLLDVRAALHARDVHAVRMCVLDALAQCSPRTRTEGLSDSSFLRPGRAAPASFAFLRLPGAVSA